MSYFILFICGSLIFVLGIILYKTKKIEILSGYDSTKKYDRDGLAKFEGKNLMYMGSMCMALGVLNLIFKYNMFFIISLGIFFIIIMFFCMRSVVLSSKYILFSNENSAKDEKKRNKVIAIVLGVIILSVIIPVGVILGVELNARNVVNINGSDIEVKAGLESRTFSKYDVKKVYIRNEIPKFRKISGTNINNINRGKYEVNGYGEGNIFLETNKGPYLYVILKDGFVIINSSDGSKIHKYYEEIK